MKKLVFVVGVALGYVIGSRQGRAGYDRLKTTANDLWNDPRVQQRVDDAQKLVRDKVPGVSDAVRKVVDKVDDASTETDAAAAPAEESSGNA